MVRHAIAAALAALAGAAQAAQPNLLPPFVANLQETKTYDGITNDLLTAGLGTAGIANLVPPAFADPLQPTADELRTRAIHQNYRALVDTSAAGGFGRLFGPNVALDGTPGAQGPIAGTETLAYARNPPGGANVTLMVQIPASFDPRRPCIVSATSSGSRGVYGAVGAVGEWALKKGCAVAYSDKGAGLGAHDLMADTVNLIDGVRQSADLAGMLSNFTAPLSDRRRETFNAEWPDRFAFKHAHSRDNPERFWGRYTLQAIELAFWAINEQYAPEDRHGRRMRAFRPENTLVIAGSVSNGGGAAIAAAEQDERGLIDGVAVSEPNVQVPKHPNVRVQRDGMDVALDSRPLYDYFTVANLYQACAAQLNPPTFIASAPAPDRIRDRCQALADKGLVGGTTVAERAADALAKLRAYGWEPESDLLHASHYATNATPGVTVTYAKAYGRFSVRRNLCDFSFAATQADGSVIPAPAANVAAIFGNGNGVPPTAGINIVNNASVGGPKLDALSTSPSSGLPDLNLDGALCLRGLATGRDPVSGHPLQGDAREDHERVAAGIAEVARSGDLGGRPAIIVHGRADALVPTNHSSRPYVALNRLREGRHSGLRYYEITNAQHFDAFLPFPGYAAQFVPMHWYGIQALELMWARLAEGRPLPPSQVVRTVPRGSAATPLELLNLGAIVAAPGPDDRIEVVPGRINVPD